MNKPFGPDGMVSGWIRQVSGAAWDVSE